LFGTEKAPFRIPPPPALANDPNRYGFNDFPIDFKTVRRGFLYLPDSCQYTSFDWLVAQYYLATQKQLMPEMDGANVRIGKMEIPRFRPTDGPYVNASNGGYQFLLDFVGPRRFTTRSVGETLALPDAGVFQGQIVILGGGSDSAKDVVDTPLEEGVYGPTVHAQIINQILRGALQGDRPPATFSLFEKGAWEIASCFLGALCGYRIRSYLLYSATLIFGAAGLIALAWLFFISGTWAPVVAPVITFLITAVTVKSYLAYYGEQQRGRLMTLFSQHVAPGVADMLWNERNKFLDGGRPVAKRLTATVLFADLRDFSTLSLEMSPQELMDWLSECLGALGQHVDRNGGVINKYIGDAIMAVYGIPVPRENVEAIARDAANAVNSALGMAGEIHRLNLRWREQGRKEARMRVGIHTGDLMAGVLGSSDRLEYTVIGDSVNVSARLESVDKANTMTGGEIDECRILISETTYDFVKDQFQARFIGSEELKGRKGQTRIFKILAKNADNT
jgi:adenylate cyclase